MPTIHDGSGGLANAIAGSSTRATAIERIRFTGSDLAAQDSAVNDI
jgi:hypothetical protein